MATELELTQMTQMVTWLDAERKKDRAMLGTLDERIRGLAELVEQQTRRTQDLESTLNAMRTTLARSTQVDRVLEEFKLDVQALLDRRDDERRKSEREAARLRALEIEDLNRSIAEIKKEMPRVGKVEEEMAARRAEEKRLGDAFKQATLQIELATKQTEERTRGIPYLEEGRKQDNKRIVQLEGDSADLRKRIEFPISKLAVLEDALGKLPARFDPVNERLGAQDKAVEEIRVGQFRQQQQMKAWQEELVKFRAQMSDYADIVARLREQAQINQKALAELTAFQDSLRQRTAEIGEVERLFEERVKRTLEQDQAGAEKRWQKYTTQIDERWQDHQRPHVELGNRVERLEQKLPALAAGQDDLREKHEELVHHLVDFGTSLAESRRSTLPNVSVPPATSPEDGRGIPAPPRGKRR